jgi:hypothetical protein
MCWDAITAISARALLPASLLSFAISDVIVKFYPKSKLGF